jgi:hypothetical protein
MLNIRGKTFDTIAKVLFSITVSAEIAKTSPLQVLFSHLSPNMRGQKLSEAKET